jgi:hypothetical protein
VMHWSDCINKKETPTVLQTVLVMIMFSSLAPPMHSGVPACTPRNVHEQTLHRFEAWHSSHAADHCCGGVHCTAGGIRGRRVLSSVSSHCTFCSSSISE